MNDIYEKATKFITSITSAALTLGLLAGSCWFALWAIQGLVNIITAIRG